MRKYLFGTGLITAIMGGVSLLRGLRSDNPGIWGSLELLLRYLFNLVDERVQTPRQLRFKRFALKERLQRRHLFRAAPY